MFEQPLDRVQLAAVVQVDDVGQPDDGDVVHLAQRLQPGGRLGQDVGVGRQPDQLVRAGVEPVAAAGQVGARERAGRPQREQGVEHRAGGRRWWRRPARRRRRGRLAAQPDQGELVRRVVQLQHVEDRARMQLVEFHLAVDIGAGVEGDRDRQHEVDRGRVRRDRLERAVGPAVPQHALVVAHHHAHRVRYRVGGVRRDGELPARGDREDLDRRPRAYAGQHAADQLVLAAPQRHRDPDPARDRARPARDEPQQRRGRGGPGRDRHRQRGEVRRDVDHRVLPGGHPEVVDPGDVQPAAAVGEEGAGRERQRAHRPVGADGSARRTPARTR